MGKQDKQVFLIWMHANYDELFTNLEKHTQLISYIETSNNQI